MANTANELASTIQAASIKRHPDPEYDVEPSTSASLKEPVRIGNVLPIRRSSATSSDPSSYDPLASHLNDEIPISVLKPAQRTHNLPPLPDLRFEQSYLARIKHCESPWSIARITFLDHFVMPLTQGVIWNLAVFGWRAWNNGLRFQGQGVGARVRRWWWGVNGWKIPAAEQNGAKGIEEFYVSKFGNAGGD